MILLTFHLIGILFIIVPILTVIELIFYILPQPWSSILAFFAVILMTMKGAILIRGLAPGLHAEVRAIVWSHLERKWQLKSGKEFYLLPAKEQKEMEKKIEEAQKIAEKWGYRFGVTLHKWGAMPGFALVACLVVFLGLYSCAEFAQTLRAGSHCSLVICP